MNKTYIYIILLLSVAFIPSLEALDKANAQWLYLSVLPFFFISKNYEIKKLSNNISYLYILFILQCFISLFYTNNINISIIDFSRHLIILLGVFHLASLFRKEEFSFEKIAVIISLFLVYECAAALSPLGYFIYNNGLDFSIISSINTDSLKGITGNRNITTASVVIKIPFLIYTIFNSRLIYSALYSLLLFFPTLVMFMINSRAALLSLIIILVIFSLFCLINHFSKSRKLLLIIIPIIISFAFSNSLVPEDNLNTTERLASINFSNESSSQRFFLWENAFDYIKSNPFIGCGIGNWKVESAAYWGSYGNKYLVPFHAHNDFIEFITELGVIGGFTYLLLFTLILFSNLIRYIKTKDIKILVLMLSFLALFVDSSLNFPFERPVIQVMFIILLAFNIKYYRNEPKQA